MSNIKACLSSNTDDWKTPSELFNYFMKKGYRDLFEYKMNKNQFDILYRNEKLYINPPFSKLKLIPDYIEQLISLNNEIILLIPSRTDTIYFHKLLKFKPKIYFIKGRLHFNDSKLSAPFPTILMEFKNYLMTSYDVYKGVK